MTEDIPFLQRVKDSSEAGIAYAAKYFWNNEKLYIFKDKGYLEYPPRGLRELMLEDFHHSNVHIGSEKLYLKLAQEYYWPTMEKDAINYVQRCLSC